MSPAELIIRGARQNNLKSINLSLPHNKITAITGVSGSGKSSLAFDTVFAEGQWRFIESISTYARLFLEKLDRPDVDAIHNIRPAIALEQKNPVRGSRSTVGTLTELYDFLSLLYAKTATPYCPMCGKEVRKWDTQQITGKLLEEYAGGKAVIIFETTEPVAEIKKRGFRRVLLNDEIVDIDALHCAESLVVQVVLDRLIIRDEPRLSDSIEMAWKEGNESLKIRLISKEVPHKILRFTSANACEECGIILPDPSPLLFSFNHPVGACAECRGFGNILKYDKDLIVPDKHLSLREGAIDPWEKPAYKWWKRQFLSNAAKAGINVRKPYNELAAAETKKIFAGTQDFYGINDFFEELEGKRYKLHVRVFLSRYRNTVTCPSCNGKRLGREALAYKLSGLDIGEACAIPIARLEGFLSGLDLSPFQRDTAKEPLRQAGMKLSFLNRVGLGYLTLNRQGNTLSGGEYQRINLSNQLASRLTGTLYVLDEPTVGLHARDTERMAEIMADLSRAGNTIIVVEHDKGIIQSSDWVVELGPEGGQQGGKVLFSGPFEKFLEADTLTARYIKGADKMPAMRNTTISARTQAKALILSGAKGNNLKDVNLSIPLNSLTAITGVSGSGKSSLIVETLYPALANSLGIERASALPYTALRGTETLKGIKIIDQSPIGKSPRSNPVTYLKIFDHIRKLFSSLPESKARGFGPGHFSFNVQGGRCESCKGEGCQKLEMYFFEDIYVKCEACNGKRYKPDTLKIFYNNKNMDDVLNMTVDEAAGVFCDVPAICSRLSVMKDVGLGYLKLGQPATTLSGGEAQRLKICSELASGSTRDVLYILDEPTVGLHFSDVRLLVSVLRRLTDAGNTVVVIEHNLDVIAASDWIVDLGPEGGGEGGRILFEGRPEAILNADGSYTGKYLKTAM